MDDVIFIISPLQRAFLTIAPFLEKTYGKKEFSSIQNKYEEITKIYQKLYDDKEIFDYVRNPKKQQRFEIGKNIYVDFRAMEMFLPDFQDEYFDGKKLLRNDKKPGKHSESPQELFARAEDYVLDINKEFATKTIVTVSHYDATLMMMKRIRNFDYDTKKLEYGLKNATFKTFYWDNTRNTEVDLHKPYIDSYWFEKK
jgi:broad specificity phosphatase PhoE